MTNVTPDSQELDHVTILFGRVCAMAKPDDPVEFVRMLCRLADVVVAEAEERWQEEQRAPVAPPTRCVYCGTEGAHDCERKRELGFDSKGGRTDVMLSKLGVLQDAQPRSMGAAAIAQRAEHPREDTATEPPAAPSTSTLPAAGQFCRSLSQESVGSATGGAEPSGPRMTRQEVKALRAAYDVAIDAHGGQLPRGWITEQAKAFRRTQQAISDRVRPWRRDPPPPQATREPVPDYVGGERDKPELVHTETPACWCRKRPQKGEHVWCKLRRIEKPTSEHPALRTPEPRAERFKVRTMQGTRY